jgi:uncharacterized cysteine cluster protein YcgN (CxxCxxCC family)
MELSQEELQSIREGAELQNYEPYIRNDIDKMKKAVVSQVMQLMQDHDFTGEVAMEKWYEYISYERLAQKIKKKIVVGQSIGQKMPTKLGV